MANRTERVVIKLTAEEVKLVKDCAWRSRLTVAHFIRQALAVRITNGAARADSARVAVGELPQLTEADQLAVRTLMAARDHDEPPVVPPEIPQAGGTAEKGAKS